MRSGIGIAFDRERTGSVNHGSKNWCYYIPRGILHNETWKMLEGILGFLYVCMKHTTMHVNGVLTVTQQADYLRTTRQAHGLCRD